jgi:hypothetical protein
MDTDGYAGKLGSSAFTTTRLCLANAVYELAASLGWKPHLSEGRAVLNRIDVGPCWDVLFTPEGEPFSLPRKRDRVSGPRRRTAKWRYVVACDPVPSVPVRCIQVDSPSHLYLVSRAMIPTHNTQTLYDVAARVTRGDVMPDGSRPTFHGPADGTSWPARTTWPRRSSRG